MGKASSVIEMIYKVVLSIVFFCAMLVLALIAFDSTEYMDDFEYCFFIADKSIFNILAIAIVLLLCIACKKYLAKGINRINSDEKLFRKIRLALLIIIFTLGTVWIIAGRFVPGSDQLSIQNAVINMLNKNYSIFDAGKYMERYPNQFGFAWFSYVLALIFGTKNYIILQFINVLALVLFYYQLSEIIRLKNISNFVVLCSAFTGVIFVPFIYYTAFIYGTIISLAFSVTAVRYEIEYFEKRKVSYLIISALSLSFAIIIKTNALIYFIGMLIYALVQIICNKKRCIALILALCAACTIGNFAPRMITEQVSKREIGGLSSYGWIAMGLQEGPKAPGWWNGYNYQVYEKNAFDSEIHAKICKESIKESVKKLTANKKYGFEFFVQKIASQWNNPTFECLWVVRRGGTSSQMNSLQKYLTSPAGGDRLAEFFNLFQFVIYIGALLYIVLYWKDKNWLDLSVLPMMFCGGFIFHFFWEAKCQYVIIYFVILFPYAILGFNKLANIIIEFMSASDKKQALKNHLRPRNRYITIFSVCALFVVAIWCTLGYKGWTKCLDGGANEYQEYLDTNEPIKIIE